MAILTRPKDHLVNDSRFKAWAKSIRSRADLDLTRERGYALIGPWVKYGDTVALEPGEFLVVAAERGSRAHHYYEHLLVGVTVDADGAEMLEQFTDTEVYAALEEIPEIKPRALAAARNSALYAFALYAWFHGKEHSDGV